MSKTTTKSGTVSTVILAALLATGCVQTPKLAHGQVSNETIKVPVTCQPKKDSKLEKMILENGSALKADGTLGYCVGSIETQALPEMNAQSVKVVWMGNNPLNCGLQGCDSFIYILKKDGNYIDANPLQLMLTSPTSDATYQIRKEGLLLSFPYTMDCALTPSPCKSSTDSATGIESLSNIGVVSVGYDYKTRRFQPKPN